LTGIWWQKKKVDLKGILLKTNFVAWEGKWGKLGPMEVENFQGFS
jgi:hypothetical protein